MARKLVVLFDGTWNTSDDQTNVMRLAQLLAARDAAGNVQLPFYDKGVGTQALDRPSGGIFGYGLSDNVRQAYGWLAASCQPDDELFIFGFSRDAYTARSLVGLIRKCGVLRSPDPNLVRKAYDLHRDKNIHPESPEATAFRAAFAALPRVCFIGFWDTVGELGVPVSGVPFSRDYFRFHDTKLSMIVDYAYHALALDENRKDFAPTVWTALKPDNKNVEQRWFIGAHSNVGDGYRQDPLPNLALVWLQQKAGACGLAFKSDVPVGLEGHLAPIRDSYAEFMYGLYKLVKHDRRHIRVFGRGVNETVDDSVRRRWAALLPTTARRPWPRCTAEAPPRAAGRTPQQQEKTTTCPSPPASRRFWNGSRAAAPSCATPGTWHATSG